ncbi:efflux RND transporter permease subunit [Blastopirellula marina]|uniref:Acriflavin resistance protein d n=1 Tax=Blastopirellula marina DSM 3645 TaxID=314230 RepID=A3ZUN8_9BACT|nr:efflux RND transporter permease subunit [Blastopirellula marina]EAQ79624.1 acriflavin resistance protein d [Blastopirellula marina DSM 3645]
MIDALLTNPVKVAVGVLLVSLFGVVALLRMPMQLTPEVDTPTLTVETKWTGASPQEVEQEIIVEQEEQLKSVEGISKMTSESADSKGTITLEFLIGTNMSEALLLVNSRLAQVPDYPEDADQPVITTSNASDKPIAWFMLSARMPSEARYTKFINEHPDQAEALKQARATDNPAVLMVRLRKLALTNPEYVKLLPPPIFDEHQLDAFAHANPQLAPELTKARDEVDNNSELLYRLQLLAQDHPEFVVLCSPKQFDVMNYRRFAEDEIEARFERVSGVSQSNVNGGLEDELQVIVDPELLASRQITIADVRRVLVSQNQDTSAGDFWEGKRRYVVRALGQFKSPEQVEYQLLAVRDGAPVFVRDVARVELGHKKPDSVVRRFGESSIAINCMRETGANVLDVMDGLQATMNMLNDGVLKDNNLELTQVYDETDYIKSSIRLVQENIFVGGALTMCVLMLFLHLGARTLILIPFAMASAIASAYLSPWWFVLCMAILIGSGFWFARGALVVALAIPISIVGTFLILGALGRSLNVISLAGMAFAVGMLVDNAVVVLENIYTYYSKGYSPLAAAARGTSEVWGAVFASTATTVAVFLPVVFVQEEAGQLFADIALAISAAVALSLVVSITVIPVAASRLFSKEDDKNHDSNKQISDPRNAPSEIAADGHRMGTVESTISHAGQRMVNGIVGLNRWFQHGVIRRLVLISAITAGAIFLCWAFWPKVEYLPNGNRNLVFGVLLPPPGYNLDQLMELGEVVEADLKPYWDVNPTDPDFNQGEFPAIRDFFFVARGRQVFMGLKSYDEQRVADLIPLIQKVSGKLPGTFAVASQSSLFERGLTGGRKIEIEITGPELPKLVTLGGNILRQSVQLIPNSQIRPVPSLDLSSPEVHVTPRWVQAADIGLSSTDMGYAVNALVDGAYAGDYFLEGKKIDVTIKGETRFADATQKIEALPVATPQGSIVPLGAIANIEINSGPEQVNHRERLRSIIIEVTPPPTVPLEEAMDLITSDIIKPLEASGELGQEYRINLAGTADKLGKTWTSLRFNLMLALLITYLLMAALFESWLYPFVIIFSVPLGAAGGILGLSLLNLFVLQSLDVLTMLGFVILIGTVVNNPILIVHQALNHMREDGLKLDEAVLESVGSRIRPIFMTTTTTVLGLMPLVMFPGSGSELYRGLGSVVLGGLILSTIFTLVLVPSLFSLTVETYEALVRMIWGKTAKLETPRVTRALPATSHESTEETVHDFVLTDQGTNGGNGSHGKNGANGTSPTESEKTKYGI